MRHAQSLRRGALVLLAGWAGASAGCITKNYYSPVPVYTAPTSSTVVPYGAVCEVPTQVEGGTVVRAPGVSVATAPSRVLVSRPSGEGLLGGRAWRSSDDGEQMATTRIEGSLDGDTLDR